jgi:beta-glucanase (GH16 family)
MANIAFGNKYFIFSKFSSIPKTSKIEQDKTNLEKEFSDFNAFSESEELEKFVELGKYLESKEHKSLVTKSQNVKAAEHDRIKLYEVQKKSKKIKAYFKFKDSQKLKDHNAFAGSKDLARYEELKTLTTSANFSANKNKAISTIKNSAEKEKAAAEKLLQEIQKQEKEFKQLSKSGQVKRWFKFQNSQKFKDFLAFGKSKELADYFTLEEYLSSEDHKSLLQSITETLNSENQKIKEHNDFKNSKKYKWYLEIKDSKKFDEFKKWKVVFEDSFSGKTLDREKWMTRYLWGDKLLNDAYALEHDKAFPTDGKNVETGGSLKIITRAEKTEGKVWKQPFGFIPQEFKYTTGLVSTAKSHRQKYGKIEAKIKVNYAKPVSYNFWMASEKMLPHVDILKLQKNKSKVIVGNVYGDIQSQKGPERKTAEFSGLDVSQDFFIYTLEWTKDKLCWKINGVTVNEQTQGVPAEAMYLVFSSSITGKDDGIGLPASMEVDWVRCYQEN